MIGDLTERALEAARDGLTPFAASMTTPEPGRLDVALAPKDLSELSGVMQPAVNFLARWGMLAAITGLDLGVQVGEIEVLYHFTSYSAGAAITTLRVRVPRDGKSDGKPSALPSICAIVPSASMFERELSEMFGVTLTGAPDTRRLYLPEQWLDGDYPMRKDFVPPGVTPGQ